MSRFQRSDSSTPTTLPAVALWFSTLRETRRNSVSALLIPYSPLSAPVLRQPGRHHCRSPFAKVCFHKHSCWEMWKHALRTEGFACQISLRDAGIQQSQRCLFTARFLSAFKMPVEPLNVQETKKATFPEHSSWEVSSPFNLAKHPDRREFCQTRFGKSVDNEEVS